MSKKIKLMTSDWRNMKKGSNTINSFSILEQKMKNCEKWHHLKKESIERQSNTMKVKNAITSVHTAHAKTYTLFIN